MPNCVENIIVVGKGELSTAILYALVDASFNHLPANHAGNPNAICNHTADPSYNVTNLTRPNSSHPLIPSFKQCEAIFAYEDLSKAFRHTKADVVISTVAPSDVVLQKTLIDAAIDAHVQHFVPCEFNYDTQDPDVRQAYPPAEARLQTLEYLRHKEDEINWTALATGCLLGRMIGLLGFDVPCKAATIYGTGNEQFPCSTLPWVGNAVVKVLDDLRRGIGSGKGQYFYKAEVITCQNELLATAEKIEGKKWDVLRADVGECMAEAKKRMEKGFLDGAMMLRERGLLFGQIGKLQVWQQEEEGDDERVERVVSMLMERMKGDDGADCGCG